MKEEWRKNIDKSSQNKNMTKLLMKPVVHIEICNEKFHFYYEDERSKM